MSLLCCPVCGARLLEESARYCCPAGHRFDRAKQGYVNLLQSQRASSKVHGDDRGMVCARAAFLERGYYEPLRRALVEKVYFYTEKSSVIADAGCGECWYTAAVAKEMPQAVVLGFDLSKDALKWGAKRSDRLILAVASCYHLPLEDRAADGVLNLFSPLAAAEYHRVLRRGGYLFRVLPGPSHLLALKRAVYEKPLPNPEEPEALERFSLVETVKLRDRITLENSAEIAALFQMTPYYYKTAPADREKLAALQTLTTETEFFLRVYRAL